MMRRHILVFVALGALVVVLLILFLLPRRASTKAHAAGKPKPSICPLCGSRLAPGERLQTILYRSGPSRGSSSAASTTPAPTADSRTEDHARRQADRRIVHIRGCPHCLESAGPNRPKRVCPVCRRKLSMEDYLLGWKAWDGEKSVVRVSGCSRCRPIHI